jgi:hypothetical protein
VLVEQRPQLDRHADGVAEPGAGLRVEVDPQLVGMRRVVGTDRRRVEPERAEAGRPGDDRELRRVDPVWLRPHPVRRIARPPLVDGAARHPARPALQHRRPVPHRGEDPGADGEEVAHDVGLGDPREVGLVRVADPDHAPVDLELERHEKRVITVAP